eukprot:TRINITY_DN37833_c0_g1_i1.p1 TRINITY_DN37833_c0_g1~~TRINITY_DN37833_c0_g1_i1.p1  ORF type:complete len:534 (+),score=181.99 TRINITY_DN37833_c0_g1_i1:48-1604(+)
MDDEDFCTVTGLPVLRIPPRLGGPCSKLSNVLYWSIVRKSVQQWSFWHDRVAIVTYNRFIITDEDGVIKRFHGVDQIERVTVDRRLVGKILILVQFAPEPRPLHGDKDILLSFNDIVSGRLFISVLEIVLNTCSSRRWTIAEGTAVESRSTDTQLARPMTESEIIDTIEQDTRQLSIMVTKQVCPTTGLPYVTPPQGLTAPNIKMLYCSSVIKTTSKGTQNPRMLFLTLQRLIVADMSGNVKRFQSMQDVTSMRLQDVPGGMRLLLEMSNTSKDLLLWFNEGDVDEAEHLVDVVTKIREGSDTWEGVVVADEDLVIRKGDGYVPPQVTLFTLRGAQHRRRSTFVLGSFCSQDAANLLDKVAKTRSLDVHGIVERAEKVERTRLWQRDLPDEASVMQEEEPLNNSFNSEPSVNSVPRVINAFSISIPCDPAKCRTCNALSRQLQENWKAPTPASPPALSASGRPPVPHLVLSNGGKEDPLSPMRSEISSARKRIQDLEEMRRANRANIQKLREMLQGRS